MVISLAYEELQTWRPLGHGDCAFGGREEAENVQNAHEYLLEFVECVTPLLLIYNTHD